ncbi:MAG: multiheme c-type cytochrome [Betaproteobacteria bacterium]|nr:multiheme c-type cytochrome [Betaproteobacteria bacterium]
MKKPSLMGTAIWYLCQRYLIIGGAVLLPLCMFGFAHAEEEGLSKETKACLKCHDKEGEEKTLDNKEKLSLHVSTKAFEASEHRKTDCEDCHSDIDASTHGKTKKAIESKRAYSLSMKDSCRECHKKPFKTYEDGLHAALVKAGDDKAPLCSDCHNSHTLLSVKIVAPISETPCAKCHEDIYKAYARDVHGLERAAKGKAAPICATCHKTHDVKAASFGDGIKDSCLACHKEADAQHKDWLPNAARHFEAISCPVCHSPDAKRRVNLRLYDSAAKKQLSEKTGVPRFEKRAKAADAGNTGLDEMALWSLLTEFNQDRGTQNTVLRGRLEVRSGVEAHQISEKSRAVKDCDTCHRSGAEAFQSVTLTIASPDGRPLRHAVQKDVLSSLTALESVRGFYAIGSTRIKLLDYALLAVLLAGIGGPLGHMTIKWLFGRLREKRLAEQQGAGAGQIDAQAPAGDRRDDKASS